MRITPVLIPCIMVGLLVFTVASWAVVVETGPEGVITGSKIIILATVQSVKSERADEEGPLYTHVTLEIKEQFKGDPLEDKIVIRVPVDTVGESGEVTSGIGDKLTEGTDAIVYLNKDDDGNYEVYGAEKGVLSIENGSIVDSGMTLEEFRKLVQKTLE